MRALRAFAGLMLGLVLLTPTSAHATPRTFAPDGVLFFPSVGGLMPALRAPHYCSASVVHSAGRNLVVTAAHCLYGTGATIEFVPGFRDGTTPFGVWTVSQLYVDNAWVSGQSATADVAFLVIAPQGGRDIEDVVGARRLGLPIEGHNVTVRGVASTSDRPTVCTNRLRISHGFPSVTCRGGIIDGVSGGAWIQRRAVVGVVGGFEQGGCSDTVAYSTRFTSVTQRLWRRAQSGAPGDFVAPGFFANSCS